MSCLRFQKKLYLYKDGELSRWEQKKLKSHLQKCSECSTEFENIQSELKAVTFLKKEILHTEPAEMTLEIIQKIEYENKFSKAAKSEKFFEIFDYIPIHQLRFVLSAIVIFLIGGLVMQEAFIWDRMNNLERRMASAATETQDISQINFSKLFGGMVVDKNSHITISKSELEKLLQSYSDVVLTNKILLEALRESIPELDESFFENGIDDSEMEKLFNNRNKIMSRLREL